MDNERTGSLIRRLRIERKLTQKQLADSLSVTDKAVSKWERGYGAPDPAYLAPLAEVLGISTEALLKGDLEEEAPASGNLKKMVFFACPKCGNVVFALKNSEVCCCGRRLKPLPSSKAKPGEALAVIRDGDELLISSDHPMTRSDYISFIALVSSDTCLIRKLYPEWTPDIHLPLVIRHGLLFHYSSRKGLLSQQF